MPDSYLLGILPKHHFRFQFADISELASHATRIHDLDRGMSVLLANTFLGSFFLAAYLKDNQRVSVQWKDETKKSVLTYSDRVGRMKGVAYPGEFREGDLRNEFILGQGILKVIRWQEEGPPYQSYSNLIESTVEENISKYIEESEQTRTYLYFQSDSDGLYTNSKGIMFQALPEASSEDVAFLEKNLFTKINNNDSFHGNPREWLDNFKTITAIDFQELSAGIPRMQCDCSRMKVAEVIVSLGESEARSIYADEGKVELSCEFCLSQYSYNEEELDRLFQKKHENS